MNLSSDLLKKIRLFLRPYLRNESERRAYLMLALGTHADALNLIWNEPTNSFILNMVQQLVSFGELTPRQPALCALLEVIRQDVGIDNKAKIDEFIQQIKIELNCDRKTEKWSGVQTLRGHSNTVQTIAISPNGKLLASGSFDRTIKLWNLETGEALRTLRGHSKSAILSLAFSPDGQTLASASNLEVADSNIKLWDVRTGELHPIFDRGFLKLRVSSIAFSPDGQYLASGNIDATLNIWHLGSGRKERTLRGHGWEIRSIAFSSDGQLLISSGMDSAIKIWNWRTGTLLHTLNRPSPSDLIGSFVSFFDSSVGTIWSVAISPDGTTIASGSEDKIIQFWDSSTGKLLRTLTEHSSRVNCVAFSPDNRTLASGGDDNNIRIWNWRTGELLEKPLTHFGPVKSVAFSPDGRTLVSGSADATVKIWRFSS